MSTYAQSTAAGRSIRVGRAALPYAVATSMLAGSVMAMIEMVYGWVQSGHGASDATMAITSRVFGAEHFGSARCFC